MSAISYGLTGYYSRACAAECPLYFTEAILKGGSNNGVTFIYAFANYSVHLSKDAFVNSNSDPHAEAMQRLLHDSEMCVRTLEQEVDNLQREINGLRHQLGHSMENLSKVPVESAGGESDAQSEGRIAQFREKNRRLREQIREQEQQNRILLQLRRFVTASFECNNANAVTAVGDDTIADRISTHHLR